MGDISFRRLVSVNNAHDLYWKESKNFADGFLAVRPFVATVQRRNATSEIACRCETMVTCLTVLSFLGYADDCSVSISPLFPD